MPEVDGVSLRSQERKALCASACPQKGHHGNERCSLGPREELFTHPTNLVSYPPEKTRLTPRDVAGKWATAQGTVIIKGLM